MTPPISLAPPFAAIRPRRSAGSGREPGRAPEARPRLLHVFPSFGIGGVQVRFAALVRALGAGYAHTVVALDGDWSAQALMPPQVEVDYVAAPAAAAPLHIRLQRYRRFLDELAPDLLLTSNWGSVELALANLTRATPHIHMEDGFGPDEAARQLPRRVWTRRIALRRSELVVPSQTLQDIAADVWRLNPRRVHFIANGLAAYQPPPLSSELRGIGPADRPRIAWVGALRPEKNPGRALRAFAPLAAHASLLVIGDGPERGALEAEAARLGLGDKVRFLGRRTDARDVMAQCQVLALSSDTEQMPLVVLEAMDAGLAVVSTDVGDVKRMVAEENRPYVVPVAEPALTAAMRALVEDEALRRRVGAANRTRRRAVYTLEAMTEAYRTLLERTLCGQRRPA